MNVFESVFNLAKRFMMDPKFVEIDWAAVNRLAKEMTEKGSIKFTEPKENVEVKDVMLQLVGGAINYCYWYGAHNIRPNGCSSGKMFEIVSESYDRDPDEFIWKLKNNLILNRFPLVEERIKHASEVIENGDLFITLLNQSYKNGPIEDFASRLVTVFPGYGSDMFLKRASLFFLMLYRFFGWFKDATHNLPVPTDYQVPKALHAEKCMIYTQELYHKVHDEILIPKGSREECEIRAATILICEELQGLTGWSISDVDGWFWLRRHEYDNWPFHLTITTDY